MTVASGYIYLEGHINPSAMCTMVLTARLALHDTLYGWPVAHFADGRVVYEHSEVHFAATHYAELSIYDPVRRHRHPLYPPKPDPPIRHAYLERVRIAYARCCVEHSPADCGGSFADRNHHCNPEHFESSVDSVVVSDTTNSLAFTAAFEDIVGKGQAIYVFRHPGQSREEYREIWSGELEGPVDPKFLEDYLAADVLRSFFEGQDLPQKAWHESPDSNSRSSTSYPFLPWIKALKIRVGMSEAKAEKVLGQRLQYNHHPVNAIFYSLTPEGKNVEVALKRSPTGAIEDISYKLQSPNPGG